jgi:hypothetical protein
MGVAAQAGRRLETLAERLRVLLHPSRTAAARGAGLPAGIDLRASFASPELERDWRVISARIETLGLTPEAGASTVHLAAGLADAHGSAAAQRLLTVDIKDVNHAQNAAWRSFRLLQSPADAMRRLGYDRLVEFRVGRSTDVLREPGEGYDLIFLDGDHRLKTVAAEPASPVV